MLRLAEYRELALARANIYSFLTGLYISPPTSEFLAHLSQPDMIAHL